MMLKDQKKINLRYSFIKTAVGKVSNQSWIKKKIVGHGLKISNFKTVLKNLNWLKTLFLLTDDSSISAEKSHIVLHQLHKKYLIDLVLCFSLSE